MLERMTGTEGEMEKAPPRAAALGCPSYVWRSGQERRLSLIRRRVSLEGARILDVGCGIGAYVRRLRELSPRVYGVDIDEQRIKRGSESLPNLMLAVAERLPFRDDSFDAVLLNEVIEHVGDDDAAVREACRVVRAGGNVVIFAPNRLYPFETHGIYIGKKYIFGNIPLVNYLPDLLRRRLAPHVRAYRADDLKQLTRGLDITWTEHRVIYPGFDNVAARSKLLAMALRSVLYALESTPLQVLGLSHFLVLEKAGPKVETQHV
ncbi:MAG: class I SAM-dependent methyltransferase [Acidobacteria bacterium]|nr:class I SAM-dependent methyltransferase [Acidobacteriota bacterium]